MLACAWPPLTATVSLTKRSMLGAAMSATTTRRRAPVVPSCCSATMPRSVFVAASGLVVGEGTELGETVVGAAAVLGDVVVEAPFLLSAPLHAASEPAAMIAETTVRRRRR